MAITYSKKGQIGILETIMVLVIVVIMIALGIFYYFQFYIEDIDKKETGLSDLDRDILLASVLTTPELRCSFNTVEQDCIDMNKVNTNFIADNKVSYIQKFGFKVIKIREVYPPGNTFTVYNNPRPNYKVKNIVSIPVSLYYSRDDYRIGRLIIEDYR